MRYISYDKLKLILEDTIDMKHNLSFGEYKYYYQSNDVIYFIRGYDINEDMSSPNEVNDNCLYNIGYINGKFLIRGILLDGFKEIIINGLDYEIITLI